MPLMVETRGHRRPVEEEGLVGTLFCPYTPGPHPAVIALGGVGGGLREGGTEALASEGFAAMALAYFGVEGLPRELVEIPLEYFEKAIEWLKSQPEVDSKRIAIVGNSKGGELALLLGATYPEDVKAIVGYAPSAVVWQGITFDREVYHAGPRSPWALGGEPVPFARFASPLPAEMVRMVGFYFGRHPIVGRVFYERLRKRDGYRRRGDRGGEDRRPCAIDLRHRRPDVALDTSVRDGDRAPGGPRTPLSLRAPALRGSGTYDYAAKLRAAAVLVEPLRGRRNSGSQRIRQRRLVDQGTEFSGQAP
jgi:pimeloyl-ACP methyl ester carboxylesterase